MGHQAIQTGTTTERREEFLNAMRFRHACKIFDPDRKISPDDERFILEAGRLSPSSMGLEPWRFLVLDDMKVRERLKEITWGAQGTLPTASMYLIILALTGTEVGVESAAVRRTMANRGLSGEAAEKFRARVVNFQQNDLRLNNDELLFHWNARQAYIAMANMMTAAAFIEIDSCPIEGFPREQVESLLAEEGLLDRSRLGVACMVAFGYRVNPQPEKKRHSLEEIVVRK